MDKGKKKMKSLRGLVFRYIWKNKLRAAMTIVAVSISAFAIFTIFSFGLGIGYNKRLNQYKSEGSWDAAYLISKGTAEEFLKLKKGEPSDVSDKSCKIKDIYVAAISESILYVDDAAYFKGVSLKNGRYPQNEKEIIVSINTLNNADFFVTPNPQVGKKVKIKRMHKNQPEEKILVGIYDSGSDYDTSTFEDFASRIYTLWGSLMNSKIAEESAYDGLSCDPRDLPISVMGSEIVDSEEYNVLVSFTQKKNIEKQAEILGDRIGASPDVNATAIALYEPDKSADDYASAFFTAVLLIVAGIIGLVVMVIIRNSFNISVSERENDYGMYRCIGLTRKQIIKMVLFEGFVIGVIGTIVGVLIGIPGCKGLYSVLNKARITNLFISELMSETGTLHFYFMWKALGLTALFMAVIVGYSMVSSIEKLFKMSPINALRSRDDIDKRVTKRLLKKKRKSVLKTGPAGYSVWYGFKNTRLRKGRFYLLVISLSVCLGVVILIGCILRTVIYTELNNQMKPAITIDGKWDNQSFSDINIDQLKQDFSGKKGFNEIGYYTGDVIHCGKNVDEEIWQKTYGYVKFYGLCERYYKLFEKYTEELSLSEEADVNNVIMIKGKVKDDRYPPEINKGDDIDYYGTKIHIAGELSPVVFDQQVMRELPDLFNIGNGYYYFFYLSESGESIIDQDKIKEDQEAVKSSNTEEENTGLYSMNNLLSDNWKMIFVYEDLLEADGSISTYLSNNRYNYYDDSFIIQGMHMVRDVVNFIVAIILVVIMLNLVNVRSADILQRRKEIRLLRNIGFSKRDIRKSVISEGLLVSICATIAGFILGAGLAYLLAKAIYTGNGMMGMFDPFYMKINFSVDWTTFIITAAVVFAINIITSLIALALVKNDYK